MTNKFLKKSIPAMLIGGMLTMGFSEMAPSKAEAAMNNNLTPEQQEVVKSINQATSEEVSSSIPQGVQLAAPKGDKRISRHRGTKLAWSQDFVEFYYSNNVVTKSIGWQEAGWIWPNLVKKKGIKRYYTSKPVDKFRGEKTIGAGTVTPWGDVTLFNTDVTDYFTVRSNGTWSIS